MGKASTKDTAALSSLWCLHRGESIDKSCKILPKIPFEFDGLSGLSRMFGDFCDRENLEEFLQCINIDGLEIGDFLGTGNFSSVYRGVFHGQEVAIKVFTRESAENEREVQVLEMIRGCPNCVQLVHASEDYPLMVIDFIDSIPQREFENTLTIDGMRNIIRSILIGLKSVHSKGIVHRDLKLDNVMVSPDFSKATIVDWGFGTRVTPKMSPGIGSRMYRSPEMLFNFTGFGTAADIWALGVIILDLLTNHNLPWNGSNVAAELREMTKIFGGEEIISYAKELGIEITEKDGFSPKTCALEDCVVVERLNDKSLVDLMKQLLTLDYRKRPTAEQALSHPFFK